MALQKGKTEGKHSKKEPGWRIVPGKKKASKKSRRTNDKKEIGKQL